MFSEKNLPKLIIYTPIIAIVFLAIFNIYLFVDTQNRYFEEESQRIEIEFKNKQKKLIKEQVKNVITYLSLQEQIYTNTAINSVIKRTYTLSTRLSQLYTDLNLELNTKKQKQILKNLINAKTTDDNYFFAFDINESQIIQPKNKDIKKEFKSDDKFFDNYLYSEEGKLISFQYSNKIVFVKYLPKLNWIIGNIQNIDKNINFIKKVSLSYISKLSFDNHGYIWVYNTKHVLLSDNKRPNEVGKDESLLLSNNEYIVQTLIKKALDNEEGDYFTYMWPKPQKNTYLKKIAFIKIFEKWNWVIGSGLYINDIKETVRKNKRNLENKVKEYIQYVIVITMLIMLIVLILSILMSNKISKVFMTYKNSVKRKEIKLKNLNQNLHKKIKIGILEAQKKDRAMLHQSRLARLGTMISMIAHQWRQPLSEVSGILMELETATKFKKVDDKLILECISESDKLLNYMSNTIDDFRNFFKPSKIKERFSLINACENAISIVNASLKDLDININKDFKEDIMINSYPREFSQVILNLLLNCKDVFEDRNILNPEINFTIEIKNKDFIISIEDNAGGISEKNIDIIFEPYFTTKSSLKGTGLGLYMSNMIIEKNMNGKLNVRNSNKGAIFEIILQE